MRADNSQHLAVAAQQRRERTLVRAEKALHAAELSGEPTSVVQLARIAGVSRAFLYAQPQLRTRLQALTARPARGQQPKPIPIDQRASSASQRRRLELAQQRIRILTEENRSLHEQVARLLGEQRAAAHLVNGAHRPRDEASRLTNERGTESIGGRLSQLGGNMPSAHLPTSPGMINPASGRPPPQSSPADEGDAAVMDADQPASSRTFSWPR